MGFGKMRGLGGYGYGNLRAIQRMVRSANSVAIVSLNAKQIRKM